MLILLNIFFASLCSLWHRHINNMIFLMSARASQANQSQSHRSIDEISMLWRVKAKVVCEQNGNMASIYAMTVKKKKKYWKIDIEFHCAATMCGDWKYNKSFHLFEAWIVRKFKTTKKNCCKIFKNSYKNFMMCQEITHSSFMFLANFEPLKLNRKTSPTSINCRPLQKCISGLFVVARSPLEMHNEWN